MATAVTGAGAEANASCTQGIPAHERERGQASSHTKHADRAHTHKSHTSNTVSHSHSKGHSHTPSYDTHSTATATATPRAHKAQNPWTHTHTATHLEGAHVLQGGQQVPLALRELWRTGDHMQSRQPRNLGHLQKRGGNQGPSIASSAQGSDNAAPVSQADMHRQLNTRTHSQSAESAGKRHRKATHVIIGEGHGL